MEILFQVGMIWPKAIFDEYDHIDAGYISFI